ncbi:arsenite-resistant protein asr2 [Lentinula edodes]|uniref:Arsenite-resistant protein asr2 n=1 Tax=Lentinula edodes TaxID=5353 RepID=A0A1Q3E4J5_LENED|nr:arsenite-resistant protein asr2 [Lentinula edodes]
MSYPIPSRRSRSRSPRGPYQPKNVYEYPPELGARDWDGYDKDRAWAAYDRERAGFDYGRRGRSRSPDDSENDDVRPLHTRETVTIRDLATMTTLMLILEVTPILHQDGDIHNSFPLAVLPRTRTRLIIQRTYATDEDNADKAAEQEAGDGSKPRNGIRSKWEKYKKDFAANQLHTMFEHHKKSPWFWEKYDPAPEFQKLRQRVRKEGWKGRLNTFLLDLETGKYDPDMNESVDANESTGSKDANGEELHIDGLGEALKPSGDDDIPFHMDAEDEVGADTNGKSASDNRRWNNAEEIAVPPEGNQVMIRTIPPDIGRVKLEDSCKSIPGYVYLALGDPLQKRNYYRAGWLRFTEDADMTVVMSELQDRRIEGFKLHVSHTMKPFVNKIRVTPDVASRPERMEKDLANTKILAGLLEEEAAVLRKFKPSKDNTQPKPEGADDVPMEENNPETADVDVEEEEEPQERGSDAVERRIEKVMAELRDQGLVDVGNEEAYETKRTEVSLDLYLAYLRAAYHACYYCSVVTDHLEELQRKCLKHVRKPLPKVSTSKKDPKKESRGRNDHDRWLDWLDQKVALLINRNGVDPRDYGGKSYDEELSKVVEPHIKQEDEGKFRCRTCQKLFKATSFVEKHIANKHPELVKSLEDIPYFNNFALDPHRIQPFVHPPTVVGNSTQAPPQAFGIQTPMNAFGDYGRMPYPPASYPPPGNGYWGDYGKGLYDGYPPSLSQRRDDSNSRRLSERISNFVADIPANAGLPPKPPAALDSALNAGNSNGVRRRNTSGQVSAGPPPPPPPDAKEDPRAAAGRRVSYHDMDLVAEGDVELTY